MLGLLLAQSISPIACSRHHDDYSLITQMKRNSSNFGTNLPRLDE
jgi:hypothetical protein